MQEKLAKCFRNPNSEREARRGVMPLGSQRTVSSWEYSVSRPTGISKRTTSHGWGQELDDKAGLINGKGL